MLFESYFKVDFDFVPREFSGLNDRRAKSEVA